MSRALLEGDFVLVLNSLCHTNVLACILVANNKKLHHLHESSALNYLRLVKKG